MCLNLVSRLSPHHICFMRKFWTTNCNISRLLPLPLTTTWKQFFEPTRIVEKPALIYLLCLVWLLCLICLVSSGLSRWVDSFVGLVHTCPVPCVSVCRFYLWAKRAVSRMQGSFVSYFVHKGTAQVALLHTGCIVRSAESRPNWLPNKWKK